MAKRIYLAVGTKKGAFILESDAGRERWDVRGPYMPGQSVMHMAHDERNGALLAASTDFWFGARVYESRDFGNTWNEPVSGPKFAEESGQSVEKIWCIAPGGADEPNVLYAGIEPAALFKSTDRGASWSQL